MSIQRIKSSSSPGWQARAYTQWPRYLSEFFADRLYGGKNKAKALAEKASRKLARKARALRRGVG